MTNTNLKKRLFNLYDSAIAYLCGENKGTESAIIGEAADIFSEYWDRLPDDIAETLGECLSYVNRDYADGEKPTHDECVETEHDLIDVISGTLGVYFELEYFE